MRRLRAAPRRRQVHRARLRDGREVAVKVQYPRVEALFRGDMATIRTFCTIAQARPAPPRPPRSAPRAPRPCRAPRLLQKKYSLIQ